MALLYFKYRTDFSNTVIASQGTPFTLGANEAQIQTDFDIPGIQPFYLYFVTGSTLAPNFDSVVNTYLNSIGGGSGYVYIATFNTYTGTTAPAQFQSHSSIVTLTGTTLPATYLTKSLFNTYTGTTAPGSYVLKSVFSTYTGTTAPAQFQSKSSIATYTGTTAPAQFQSHSSIVTLTGTTLPATYHTKVAFNSFTGTTLPATYQSRSSINTLTGTTLPATYLGIGNFNTYSGATLANINSRLLTSSFNTYSAATATQIQLAQYGLDWKVSVYVATTANIALTGNQTIDGIAITAGKRILVKSQTTASQNGIYVSSAGAWTRSTDADGSATGSVTTGLYTFIETGSTNHDTAWVLTTLDPITVGTTPLTFTKVTTLSDLLPGNGISISNNTVSVKPSDIAGSGLLSTSTQLFVNVTGGTVFSTFTPRTIFNTYTGTTAPATYATKANFNLFTGTTAPATYLTKASFNAYSANTLTTINTKLNTSIFNTYTGTTAPATYATKVNFNLFTGTTAPATYKTIASFNAYTASTINVTSANNGLIKTGNNVRWGGTLTGATTVDATTSSLTLTGSSGQLNIARTTGAINVRSRNGVNLFGTSVAGVDRIQLKISATGATFTDSRTGTTAAGLQYAADYSSHYNARSVIDYNAFTANTLYTKAQILVYASGSTDTNVTTPVALILNRLIRNNSTYFTYTGGTKIKILQAGIYDVAYQINVTNSNGILKSAAANLVKNGASVVETTTSGSLGGQAGAGCNLSLPSTQLTFAANDIISLAAFRLIAPLSGTAPTTANAVFLSIVKKY